MTDNDDTIVPKYRPLFRSLLAEQAERLARPLDCEFVAYRVYGQPKLSKPKLLKGLKPEWKQDVCRKPAHIYSLADGSFVIYFGALFCKPMLFPDPKDMALPTCALVAKYPERFEGNGKRAFKSFVYADAWCPIYERNEGYVRVSGLKERMDSLFCVYPPKVAYELFDKFSALSLKDKGFASIYNENDMLAAEYRRFIDDFVFKLFDDARKKSLNFFQNTSCK